MVAFMQRILLLGAVGVILASAVPDGRFPRQSGGDPLQDPEEEEEDSSYSPEPLGLPANASALLPGPAVDSFSCAGRPYGYYADPDNACRVFHVCLSVALPGADPTAPPTDIRFSFVCPAETQFNQESFTCTRPEDAIACEESPNYYHLNDAIGVWEPPTERSDGETSDDNAPNRV